MKTRGLVLTGLTLLLAVGLPAASAPATDLPTALEAAAAKMIATPLLHSTSIGVIYRGKEFRIHRGELETGKGQAPDDTTIYEIGSLSKTFAGLLLAQAVLDGKVSLDDEVQRYLPDDYPALHEKGRAVLVRHLLTHTSTLPGMLPLPVNTLLDDFTAHSTPARLSVAYAGYDQKAFWRDLHQVRLGQGPLGKDYAYSSVGTELVAHILETVYQRDYEALLKDYLARHAGMRDTRLRLDAAALPRLAPGYHSDNPVATTPMPQLPWGAAGNLKSTLPDMLRYLRLQLGTVAAVRISHQSLLRFADDFSIAYFWNIGQDRQLGSFYRHHGGVPRAQSYLYLVPKYELGVFIITNQSGADTARAMEAALEDVFDTVEVLERQRAAAPAARPD